MRRRNYYTVEYYRGDGQPDAQEDDEYLSKGRAHELAFRWVRMYPEKAAIIYFEETKWYGWTLDHKGKPQKDGAKRTWTVAQVHGLGYKGPKPLRSIMQRHGKVQEMDVPVLVPSPLDLTGAMR